MAKVLGINAVFHDPAAAIVIDGKIIAAAEEERFSRRKHGKLPVPFSTWELPVEAALWCLEEAGIQAEELDAVAYSYDPALVSSKGQDITANEWEGLRTLYAERAPLFLKSALPGLKTETVKFIGHHLAHAASAYLASPFESSAVMVLDGRGERSSYLSGHYSRGQFSQVATQELPHSLGLLYEEVTEYLGFRRSSGEYKVMALAAYGKPEFISDFRKLIKVRGNNFSIAKIDLSEFAPPRKKGAKLLPAHANLASTVQKRLEEALLELCEGLYLTTGEKNLTMAGGMALNCVANSVIAESSRFENLWIQPAAGDSGTALGAALYVADQLGDKIQPMTTAALGRGWSDDELGEWLRKSEVVFEKPDDLAASVADVLAGNGVVGWFQGRSEWGPRALGRRSLLANPSIKGNLDRLNAIKGRERFRPVAPMVLEERAADIFEGPLPSPYMLFTHRTKDEWSEKIPAALHVDGSARIQTINPDKEPLLARLLGSLNDKIGVPVVINTSFNTAGRPIVDDPGSALECFGSAPIDALAIGPYLVRRQHVFGGGGYRNGEIGP